MPGALLVVSPNDEIPSAIDEQTSVVVTLRPLASTLPSAWLAQICNRLPHTYEAWLGALLASPPKDWPTVKAFWRRHHYDVLVERWVAVAGTQRVRVRVLDRDPLTPPLLDEAAAELLRRINVVFHRRDWPVERYREVVGRGVAHALETRNADTCHRGPVTPSWAIRAANKIASLDAKHIAASGVAVEGDLKALSQVRVERDGSAAASVHFELDAAVAAVMGAVEAVTTSWRR